jgi:hypothetical protein
MMIPPPTILEMHTFLRDEVQKQRESPKRSAGVSESGEHRLAQRLRTLLRRPQRGFHSRPRGDHMTQTTT